MTAVVQESHVRKRGTGTSSGIARDHLDSFPLQRLCFSPKAIPLEFNRQNPSKPKALQPIPFPELLQLDMRISSGHRFPSGGCNSWTPAGNIYHRTRISALSTCACQTVTKIERRSGGSGNTEIPNIKIHRGISG